MAVRSLKRSDSVSDQFPRALLDSLSEAVVVVDGAGLIHYANLSAEQFFGVGRARLNTARACSHSMRARAGSLRGPRLDMMVVVQQAAGLPSS